MRNVGVALIALVSALALGSSALANWPIVLPFDGVPRIELDFQMGSDLPSWAVGPRSATKAVYTWQGHKLTLTLEKSGIQQIVRMRLDAPPGKSLSVRSYSARLAVPTSGLHAVTCPNARGIAQGDAYYKYYTWPEVPPLYHCLIPASFQEPANANCDAPFILLTDKQGNNAMSLGWTSANIATSLTGAAEGDNYIITLARQNDIPFTGASLQDALVVSSAKELWFDVATAYAKTFDRINKRTHKFSPEWTTDPTFDTWYCYGDRINQEQILNVARKCKELGIRTVLIDAGWDTPSDSGYIKFESGVLGDHMAQKERFPDLVGAIREMHDMGLRVELWCSPFWEGKLSSAYRNVTGSWHLHTADGEHHCLCPRVPKLPGYFRERFAWIAKTYDCDGMWLDSGDNVPPICVANHEHVAKPMGDAFIDCMVAAREGLRSVKPDSIIEVRPLHGNLNSKPAFDLIQPSDAPDKLDTQRMASVHLRTWCYDTQVKSDPIRWGKRAAAPTVGKFMATTICLGVPALSVDWLTATDEQLKVAKAWLDFYREHKQTLLRGKFRPFGATYWNPDLLFVGKDEAIAYLRSPDTREIPVPANIRRAIVLNATERDLTDVTITCSGQYKAQSYAPDWTPSGSAIEFKSDGKVQLSQPVPQGGAVVIERG